MRLESTWAVLLTLALPTAGTSQVVAPPAAHADPASLEAALPALACQALPAATGNDAESLERRLRLQFSCGRYEAMLDGLQTWMRQRAPVRSETVEPWLRLELHARASVRAQRERIAYDDAFASEFERKFSTFDDLRAVDSAWMLGLPPLVARANLDRRLQEYAGRDSLAQSQLLDLLYWHSAWQAAAAFAPRLDAVVAADDARRFIIERGVRIRSRRGATLTADFVRPRRLAGLQPTALRFTIYSDPGFNLRGARSVAAHGYVAVVANARGKYLSEDPIVPWETEVDDTWAIIDWISRQPWSDGQVGMYGNSYDARRRGSATALAMARNELHRRADPRRCGSDGN